MRNSETLELDDRTIQLSLLLSVEKIMAGLATLGMDFESIWFTMKSVEFEIYGLDSRKIKHGFQQMFQLNLLIDI